MVCGIGAETWTAVVCAIAAVGADAGFGAGMVCAVAVDGADAGFGAGMGGGTFERPSRASVLEARICSSWAGDRAWSGVGAVQLRRAKKARTRESGA